MYFMETQLSGNIPKVSNKNKGALLNDSIVCFINKKSYIYIELDLNGIEYQAICSGHHNIRSDTM